MGIQQSFQMIGFASKFSLSNNQCQSCTEQGERLIFQFRIDNTSSSQDMVDLIKLAMVQNGICLQCQNLEKMEGKCMVIQLSKPISVNLHDQDINNDLSVKYRSHIENQRDIKIFFRFDNQMYTQGLDDSIY